jgi:hypothetical protein
VDLLAVCISLKVVGAILVIFFWAWRKICKIFQAMGSKAEEMSQTLMTNKKQGNLV